jgi:hypothetical protein
LGSSVVVQSELRGRLGPLVGALLDEAEDVAPAFDFANPRRRPSPPNQRKRMIAAAAVAATLVALVTSATWLQLRTLDAEIEATRKKSAALAPLVKEAEAVEKRAAEVEKWLKSDVVWLDELARLAKLFPTSKEAMLTQLRVGAHPQGGEMQLTGVLAESSVGDAVDTKLRDATHAVEGRGRRYDPAIRQYPWQFQTIVVVKNGSPSEAPPKGGR